MSGAQKVDPELAWTASCAAVELVMGGAPPAAPSALRGGERSDTAASWRRKVAIYTAAISLGAGVRPLAPHMKLSHSYGNLAVRELEDLRDGAAIDELLNLVGREAARRMVRAERPGRAA